MRILVSGDGGFIGRHLCADLTRMGHEAIGLGECQRRQGLAVPRFGDSLRPILEAVAPDGMVHCALKRHDPDGTANFQGTAAWAEDCRAFGLIRQVFISSISAGTVDSAYGRGKLELERELTAAGAVALRLGLVMGDGGVFLTLSELLRRFHFFPLIDGGRNPVFPLLVDYVAVAVERALCEFQTLSGQVRSLYEPGELTMKRFLAQIARSRQIRYLALPCPSWLLSGPVRVLEMLLAEKSPITRDNLLGLAAAARPEQSSWLDELRPKRPALKDQVAAALAMFRC